MERSGREIVFIISLFPPLVYKTFVFMRSALDPKETYSDIKERERNFMTTTCLFELLVEPRPPVGGDVVGDNRPVAAALFWGENY